MIFISPLTFILEAELRYSASVTRMERGSHRKGKNTSTASLPRIITIRVVQGAVLFYSRLIGGGFFSFLHYWYSHISIQHPPSPKCHCALLWPVQAAPAMLMLLGCVMLHWPDYWLKGFHNTLGRYHNWFSLWTEHPWAASRKFHSHCTSPMELTRVWTADVSITSSWLTEQSDRKDKKMHWNTI